MLILNEVNTILTLFSLQYCSHIFVIFFWTCSEYLPIYGNLECRNLLIAEETLLL